jgi:hypothetical protein
VIGELPPLPDISRLIPRGAPLVRRIPSNPILACDSRLISGEALSQVIRACPRLESVEVGISDKESKDLHLRNTEHLKTLRLSEAVIRIGLEAFAADFINLPQSINQLMLDYPGVVPADRFFRSPAIPLTGTKIHFSWA